MGQWLHQCLTYLFRLCFTGYYQIFVSSKHFGSSWTSIFFAYFSVLMLKKNNTNNNKQRATHCVPQIVSHYFAWRVLGCWLHFSGPFTFRFFHVSSHIPVISFHTGRAPRVMDSSNLRRQSTETLFSWLLLILTELCRRFRVPLGNVIIECFEVNYSVPASTSQ